MNLVELIADAVWLASSQRAYVLVPFIGLCLFLSVVCFMVGCLLDWIVMGVEARKARSHYQAHHLDRVVRVSDRTGAFLHQDLRR